MRCVQAYCSSLRFFVMSQQRSRGARKLLRATLLYIRLRPRLSANPLDCGQSYYAVPALMLR